MPVSPEKLKKLLFLSAAPMAGISSPTFRYLCRRMGATLTFTEMISARGLITSNQRTRELLAMRPGERPTGAQLFGTVPGEMAEAAARIEAAGFDLVDINMGCPVRKIISGGAGAALMTQVELAARLVKAMVEAVKIPVTAKIRSGWSADSINAVEMAKALEGAGLAALTVHARTRDQGYAGKADWPLISAVKNALRIPVVGNGDVVDGASAVRLQEETGCDGVMIGRAALGNPWIFRDAARALEGAEPPSLPTGRDRFALFLAHFRGLRQETARDHALPRMKKFGAWYIRGCRGAAPARKALHGARSARKMVTIVKGVLMS